MTITNDYEIGGITVTMTAEQATRWNNGEWTDEDDTTAKVGLPDEYEQSSSLRDGEVLTHDSVLVKHSEEITMAQACERGLHNEYMNGMPANLIREDV